MQLPPRPKQGPLRYPISYPFDQLPPLLGRLSKLPRELQEELLLHLDYRTIVRLCHYLPTICKDVKFWARKAGVSPDVFGNKTPPNIRYLEITEGVAPNETFTSTWKLPDVTDITPEYAEIVLLHTPVRSQPAILRHLLQGDAEVKQWIVEGGYFIRGKHADNDMILVASQITQPEEIDALVPMKDLSWGALLMGLLTKPELLAHALAYQPPRRDITTAYLDAVRTGRLEAVDLLENLVPANVKAQGDRELANIRAYLQ